MRPVPAKAPLADAGVAQNASPDLGSPALPPAPLAWGDLIDVAALGAEPPAVDGTDGPVAAAPASDLAALRERARLARAQLGDQPLPIANQSSRLILKLLGG